MAQRQKSELRARILDATLDLLAERGYAGTSIAAVAEAAGISVGNLYRYFASKDELAAAALPEERIGGLLAVVTGRLEALAARGRETGRRPESPREPDAAQVAFLAGARRELVFLFEGAEGSPFEGFRRKLLDALVESFLRYRRSGRAGDRGSSRKMKARREAEARIAVPIYSSLISTMAGVIRASGNPEELMAGIGLVMRYHLAGMAALMGREGE
jgi:AcrR family transcriptional regulator